MSHDEANGAALLEQDASPSDSSPTPSPDPAPSPHPRPNRGVRSLFFSGAETPEEETWSPPAAPVDDAGSASPVDGPSDPGESREETGPPASSADGGGPLKPLGKAAMKATAAKAVLISTSMVHRAAARTELQRRAGLYLADEEDQDLISDPIASLVHRRAKAAGGAVVNNPDVNDGIQLAMALANYVTKQVSLVGEIRHLEASGVQVQPTVDGEVA